MHKIEIDNAKNASAIKDNMIYNLLAKLRVPLAMTFSTLIIGVSTGVVALFPVSNLMAYLILSFEGALSLVVIVGSYDNLIDKLFTKGIYEYVALRKKVFKLLPQKINQNNYTIVINGVEITTENILTINIKEYIKSLKNEQVKQSVIQSYQQLKARKERRKEKFKQFEKRYNTSRKLKLYRERKRINSHRNLALQEDPKPSWYIGHLDEVHSKTKSLNR